MISEQRNLSDGELEKENPQESSPEENFINVARKVLAGELTGINVEKGDGNLRLLNADRLLIYQGYTPEQEWMKGLICRELPDGSLEIVAPCFHKFYNLGENPGTDQRFHDLVRRPEAKVHFPEKIDGTNIRFYVDEAGKIRAGTRGMLDGGRDPDEEDGKGAANIHFGQESLRIAQERFPDLLDKDLLKRYTPVFELIHPENRIVTDYGDREDLVLLAVFDKQNGCRELTREELSIFAKEHGLHLVGTYAAPSPDFDEAVAGLRRQWEDTDKEGTVATIEENGEVVFRLKIKSRTYLELMRAMKFCTLKQALGLINETEAKSWEEFKQRVHEKFPTAPEEILMGYEIHYRTMEEYNAGIERQIDAIVADYRTFVDQHPQAVSQKDFALMIKDRPDKAFFFLLRRFGLEKLEEMRPRIIEELKKVQPIKDFAASKN